MNLDEKAKIVALARLLGVKGTDQAIFDMYWEYYQNALKSFDTHAPREGKQVEVFKRPF